MTLPPSAFFLFLALCFSDDGRKCEQYHSGYEDHCTGEVEAGGVVADRVIDGAWEISNMLSVSINSLLIVY